MRTDARLQRCCISSVLFDKLLDRTLIHALALQTEEKGIFVTRKRIDVLPLHQVGLKRVCYFPQKNMIVLKPENPKYEDLIFTGQELSEIRILGKAVAFQSSLL